MMEWIKIDKFGFMPKEKEFLLSNEWGYVYVGTTAFDYYDADAIYWCPMPTYPILKGTITNDEWVHLAQRTEK